MSAFLIGFTVLVVFLLFYMSKRLICSGPNFSTQEEDCEDPVWTSSQHCCDYDDNGRFNPESAYICESNNNNNVHQSPIHSVPSRMTGRYSQVEYRLRSHVFHMILAENEYRRLELEASRLARLLSSSDQEMNPEDYIRNIRNELSPFTSIAHLWSPRRTGGLGSYQSVPQPSRDSTNLSIPDEAPTNAELYASQVQSNERTEDNHNENNSNNKVTGNELNNNSTASTESPTEQLEGQLDQSGEIVARSGDTTETGVPNTISSSDRITLPSQCEH